MVPFFRPIVFPTPIRAVLLIGCAILLAGGCASKRHGVGAERNRQLRTEAGQTYEIAIQLASSSPNASDYAKWLIPVVENALKLAPENQQYVELLNRLRTAKKN